MSAIGLEVGDMTEPDPYEFLDGVEYKSVADLMKKAGLDEEHNPFTGIAKTVKKRQKI